MLDLSVVIVNWNTRDLLRACLRSLVAGNSRVQFQVIVVDNASSDGSAEMVRAEFPEVELIARPVNGGFSHANNLGLRRFGFTDLPHPKSLSANGEGFGPQAASSNSPSPSTERGAGGEVNPPRYILLLNPDTVVPPDALYTLVAHMDANPTIGIVGPKLTMPNGKLDLACRRSFPTPEISFWRMIGFSKLFPRNRRFGRYNMTFVPDDVETDVDSVVGAFMLVRREAIIAVGLLDEAFWMYGEDLDWAYRIKQAGWRVRYVPRVSVLHVKRAASRHNPRAQVEFSRAMLIFYRKHYRAQTPPWLHLMILAGLLAKGGRPLLRAIRTDTTRWSQQPT